MTDTRSRERQHWIEEHRARGHHPYPAPTTENPERWECKCTPGAPGVSVWRVLTVEQIGRKFAHLHRQLSPEKCRYNGGTCLTHRPSAPGHD